jgi:hypothetical protein
MLNHWNKKSREIINARSYALQRPVSKHQSGPPKRDENVALEQQDQFAANRRQAPPRCCTRDLAVLGRYDHRDHQNQGIRLH